MLTCKKSHSYNQRITKYYRDRYNAGVSELREWLAAANTEKALTFYLECKITTSFKLKMPYIAQWLVITPVKIMIKEVSASSIFFMDMKNEKIS